MMIKNAIYVLMIQWPFEIWHHNHEEFMKWCDLIDPDGFEPQTLNLIWTLHVFCWNIHAFLRRDVKVRNRVGVLTATARSTDDIICLRTSSMHISERTSCLMDLIWRCWWIMSPWAIDFYDNEKWSQGAFSERLRMNSNRSKTACSRFCRIVCWFWLVAWDRVSLVCKLLTQ